MCALLAEQESDPLGFEDYGYPNAMILKDCVRICLGWFMPDLDPENEPAYYLDVYFDTCGEPRVEICNMDCHFDFLTPIHEYGTWHETGEHRYFLYRFSRTTRWRWRKRLREYLQEGSDHN